MSELRDPRVLFAAERTLLAWTRTSLTLMAFGFAVERFSLFFHTLRPELPASPHGASLVIGLALLFLGAVTALASVVQYRRVLRTLAPAEIPAGYWTWTGAALNVVLGVLGAVLLLLLARQHF